MPTADQEVARQTWPERPFFLLTIDTEGDNIWRRERRVEVKNAAFLLRFQRLCEKYGFKPTYLANYEMVDSAVFRDIGRDILKRSAGEVGMHLHAWHSPPEYPLTENDHAHHPYLIEYPTDVMRGKIAVLTGLLEDAFGVKMVSHRAGRWSFNATYARLLVERGYRVDCSVTPYVSWKWALGDPRRAGGTDFSHFPARPYFIDLDNISQPGRSELLEVPMTTVATQPLIHRLVPRAFPSRTPIGSALNRLFPVRWLRPNGRNLKHLLRIVARAISVKSSYVELMLHSSELMPGGSPTFPTAESIEILYEHLEQLLARAARSFQGATLAQFYGVSREAHRGSPVAGHGEERSSPGDRVVAAAMTRSTA
jgi:hypothetical protein